MPKMCTWRFRIIVYFSSICNKKKIISWTIFVHLINLFINFDWWSYVMSLLAKLENSKSVVGSWELEKPISLRFVKAFWLYITNGSKTKQLFSQFSWGSWKSIHRKSYQRMAAIDNIVVTRTPNEYLNLPQKVKAERERESPTWIIQQLYVRFWGMHFPQFTGKNN